MRTLIICTLSGLAVVILRWLAVGAADDPLSTTRISVDSAGAQANGESTGPALSADGRYVVFVSWATNLVPGDANGAGDVFVKNRLTGTTTRVSVASDGAQVYGESYAPAISGDGRYVAFTSEAPNLVLGDTNGVSDVFVHDMTTGATVRVSVGTDGHQANGASTNAVLSADGHFVAFVSRATNLIAPDTNDESDVFVHDLQTGATERASVGPAGQEADGASEGPSLSADGHYIAFASTAGNLVSPPDTNKAWDVFVRDRTSGSVVRASLSSAGGQGDGHSFAPSLSADGHFVAFVSEATNLVSGDTNNWADVFVRDLVSGTTSRLSGGLASAQANGASAHPSISGDGHFVAFSSYASNLVAGDTNEKQDVFLFDRQAGTTARMSVGLQGAQGQGAALWPVISADGRFVAFPDDAAQLTSGDTNGVGDIFLRGPLF